MQIWGHSERFLHLLHSFLKSPEDWGVRKMSENEQRKLQWSRIQNEWWDEERQTGGREDERRIPFPFTPFSIPGFPFPDSPRILQDPPGSTLQDPRNGAWSVEWKFQSLENGGMESTGGMEMELEELKRTAQNSSHPSLTIPQIPHLKRTTHAETASRHGFITMNWQPHSYTDKAQTHSSSIITSPCKLGACPTFHSPLARPIIPCWKHIRAFPSFWWPKLHVPHWQPEKPNPTWRIFQHKCLQGWGGLRIKNIEWVEYLNIRGRWSCLWRYAEINAWDRLVHMGLKDEKMGDERYV